MSEEIDELMKRLDKLDKRLASLEQMTKFLKKGSNIKRGTGGTDMGTTVATVYIDGVPILQLDAGLDNLSVCEDNMWANIYGVKSANFEKFNTEYFCIDNSEIKVTLKKKGVDC